MGIADSPLRDRVIFVVGAPRSGTTLLAGLLEAHPQVAGITSESHLFDRGVGTLFDNFEGMGSLPFLSAYLDRERFVDLVRDLVDGILLEVRAQTKSEARFVLEKTPSGRVHPEVPLARKLECYPDAWFVHIVRDREAVVRSLMKAWWNQDRSREAGERWWETAVGGIREVLSGHERYREVAYEEVSSDHVGAATGVFEWLGLDLDEGIRDRVNLMSKERFADFGPGAGDPGREPLPGSGAPSRRSGLRRLARGVRRPGSGGRVRRSATAKGGTAAKRLTTAFGRAFREGDREELARLTAEGFVLHLNSSEGDLKASGDEAREACLAVSRQVFGAQFQNEQWSIGTGEPLAVVVFSGLRPNGRKVDLSWNLRLEDGRVSHAILIAAGSFEGRPLREWEPAPSAGD